MGIFSPLKFSMITCHAKSLTQKNILCAIIIVTTVRKFNSKKNGYGTCAEYQDVSHNKILKDVVCSMCVYITRKHTIGNLVI